MIRYLICNQFYSRRDTLQRLERNVHGSGKTIDQSQPLTFQHPFSMMVTGPCGLGNGLEKMLFSSLIQLHLTNLMVFWTMAAPVRRP